MRGSGSFLFTIFLPEMPFGVDGTVVVVIVPKTPDDGAMAVGAVADCAYKALFSAMQKLISFSIVFDSLTSAASRRCFLIARMSRTLLFSGAFMTIPSASTSLN